MPPPDGRRLQLSEEEPFPLKCSAFDPKYGEDHFVSIFREHFQWMPAELLTIHAPFGAGAVAGLFSIEHASGRGGGPAILSQAGIQWEVIEGCDPVSHGVCGYSGVIGMTDAKGFMNAL